LKSGDYKNLRDFLIFQVNNSDCILMISDFKFISGVSPLAENEIERGMKSAASIDGADDSRRQVA